MLSSLTTFVGRREELDRLREVLSGGDRLITLVGPPGVGKSRLAREALANTERVRIAELAEARSLTLDESLSLWVSSPEPRTLVLDDFDRLVAESLTVVEWLDRNPHLRIVVTSREVLSLQAERRVSVGPLAPEDACALFANRAELVEGLDEADRQRLPELVRRLGCNALAIELAAAQTASMSVAQISERLDRGPSTLESRERDRRPDHRSLVDAIQRSWELLTPSQQTLARRCALARGFDLELARALADGEHELRALVDKSFVEVASGHREQRRYRMFPLIREVAESHLQGDERSGAERRFAAHLLERLRGWDRDLRGPARPRVVAETRANLENLEHAHALALEHDAALAADIAVSLWRVLELTGPRSLGLRVLDASLERAPDSRAAVLKTARARALALHGQNAEASELLEPIEADADLLGLETRRRVAMCRGLIEIEAGNVERGLDALQRALELGDDDQEAIEIRMFMAIANAGERRYDDAVDTLLAATERARAEGLPHVEARLANNLGFVRHLAGNLSSAEDALARAATIAQAAGDAVIETTARLSLAMVRFERADADGLGGELERLDAIIDEVADGRLAAYHAMCRVLRSALRSDLDAARRALVHAERIAEATGLTYGTLPVELIGGVIDVVHGGDSIDAARARLNLATEPDDEGKSAADRSLDVRIAHRLLRVAIEREEQTWELGDTWFRAPGGERVDLARRKKLCRLLGTFVRKRLDAPGVVLDYDALREAGWPGEKMLEAAALRRIYVAVGELRKLGLELIETAEDGYRLSPNVPIRVI